MQNNDPKTFWCNDEDSDEDLESIFNTKNNQNEKLNEEAPGILPSDKMNFLWSDDEENDNFDIISAKKNDLTDKNNNNLLKKQSQDNIVEDVFEIEHKEISGCLNNSIFDEQTISEKDTNKMLSIDENLVEKIKNISLQEKSSNEENNNFIDVEDTNNILQEKSVNEENNNFINVERDLDFENILDHKSVNDDFFSDDDEDETIFYNTINKSNLNIINSETVSSKELNMPEITEQESQNDIDAKNIQENNLKDQSKHSFISKDTLNKSQTQNISDLNKNNKISNADFTRKMSLSKPICVLFGRRLLTVYETLLPRYTSGGEKKELKTNLVIDYKLREPYSISNLDSPLSYDSEYLNLILQIFNLKNIHANSVGELIGAKPVRYCSKNFTETENISDCNTALNMFTHNNISAVDYCISKKMWTLALLLSNGEESVKNRVYSEICDDDMAFLFNSQVFSLKRPWKDYFMHFANGHSNHSDKYILEVFRNDSNAGYLVLIALFLCKVVDIKNYLGFFSHKHQLLPILIHINDRFSKIDGIDLLLYEYICDLIDRKPDLLKEFYKKYKKQFRKELQETLDKNFKMQWNFGIKEMLNFGIAKILDVPEDETNIKKNPMVKQKQIFNEEKKDHKIKEVYGEQNHSKSFADFFENPKDKQEDLVEDDTALFLSKYNLEDEDKSIKKSESTVSDSENKGYFSSMFNIFKKKTYKIDVQASDDIKYDPVTKKWVSSSSSLNQQEKVEMKNEIPIPKIKPNESSKKNITDLKKMSLYAGKKKSSVTSFSTFKKDN